MQNLPTELLDHIFSFFTDHACEKARTDSQALASVCLVSRRFHHLARPHLYRSIRIKVRSDQAILLHRSLKADPQLVGTVQELSIEDSYQIPTPSEYRGPLRTFTQDVLPYLYNLAVLRSNSRVVTAKLVGTTLYKDGGGYFMSIPTDLSNLKSLELYASDYVFKYNYILRLPQLERVCLHWAMIVDLEGNDDEMPNDWGWQSESLRGLELRPAVIQSVRFISGRWVLKSNTLQALSRCMPHLESLCIKHFEPFTNRTQCRDLAQYFKPQISSTLKRLEIRDGRIEDPLPRDGDTHFHPADVVLFDSMQDSNLEYLFIDWFILTRSRDLTNIAEILNDVDKSAKLEHITLRYIGFDPLYTKIILEWDPQFVVHQTVLKFPALKRIDLELRLLAEIDQAVLQKYTAEFHRVGIALNVLEHKTPTPETGSITCSRRT